MTTDVGIRSHMIFKQAPEHFLHVTERTRKVLGDSFLVQQLLKDTSFTLASLCKPKLHEMGYIAKEGGNEQLINLAQLQNNLLFLY